MVHLPVIVGFGGLNAAGRTSFHHGYRRLVVDALPKQRAKQTWSALAALMRMPRIDNPSEEDIAHMRAHTLVRRIEPQYFDVERTRVHLRAQTSGGAALKLSKTQALMGELPESWQTKDEGGSVAVTLPEDTELFLPNHLPLAARAAGQVPSGSVLGEYGSRQHPRGIELSVYGLSDALNSLGIEWDDLVKLVPPEQISVYAGSAMGQLDDYGVGGLLRSSLLGKHISARCCPLSLVEMCADFANAYSLGNMGNTGGYTGACATLLYNLRAATEDIRAGRAQIAVVGASEAPIVPDVISSYVAMGALATDEGLRKIDNIEGEPDWRKACRPFANNCGFTIAEASQYFILFSDTLALKTGAQIHGSIAEVCINADGHKGSISSSGAGNYLSVARALAAARALLGERALHSSYALAHGTGTPQNRVTESHVLNENAKWFGISDWPVAAIKCYLGHSVSAAAGDQLATALGSWVDRVIPGISTMDKPAEDVHRDHLSLSNEHRQMDDECDLAVINSKGFGGNNASGAIISPRCTQRLLAKRHGSKVMKQWSDSNAKVATTARESDERLCQGKMRYHYRFDHNVYKEGSVKYQQGALSLPDGQPPVELDVPSPYPDLETEDGK